MGTIEHEGTVERERSSVRKALRKLHKNEG